MCDVEVDGVVAAPDAPSIYDIPRVLHREGLDAYVVRRLALPFRDVDWTVWGDLLDRVHHPRETVRIALVGKYVDLPDAYLSVTEALRAGGFAHHARVEIDWVPSDECRTPAGAAAALDGVDGVLIPGGFGVRGIEGKLGAVRYARTRGIPPLGLCLGLQCMVIEAARSLAGLDDANSSRVRRAHPAPGDLDDGRPARRRRGGAGHGRHHAPGRLPRGARHGHGGRGGVRRRARCPSGTGTATRSTTPTATRLGRSRAGVRRHVAGRHARRVRRAARATPTRSSSARRPIRSSRADRRGRTRSSPASCGPRSPTGRPSGSRSTRPPASTSTAGVNGTGA